MRLFHVKHSSKPIGDKRGIIVETDAVLGGIDNISLLLSMNVDGTEMWIRFFMDFYSWEPWYKRVSFSLVRGKYGRGATA